MASLHNNFREQYGKQGIFAGSSHFHDYWARDELFACYGALALKDYDQVRRTLQFLLDSVSENGHVPLRIGAKNQVLSYLGLPTAEGVWHNQDKGSNESYDGNALLLILIEKYESLTKKRFSREQIKAVVHWLNEHDREGLLHQGPYSDWEDSIKITGPRLYTNVCYYRALLAASKLLGEKRYKDRATRTKVEIQKWWNGTHFDDGPKNTACMTAGNLLSIVWGVATPVQAKKILGHIARRETVCPPAGFWKPGITETYIPFFLLHLQDYHGMMEWSWLAALEIIAYKKTGNKKEAAKREEQVILLIAKHGALYEVYKDNKPVKRLIYRSEKDFSWALGLFIASQLSGASLLQ